MWEAALKGKGSQESRLTLKILSLRSKELSMPGLREMSIHITRLA